MKYLLGYIIFFLFLVGISFLLYQHAQYKEHFRGTFRSLVAQNLDEGSYDLETKDYYNQDLIYIKEVEKGFIRHQLRSCGGDGLFLTDDDYVLDEVNLNKSRIIGNWAGRKSREFFKGFLGGVKQESEFDE